jgi:tetratricopeptide (TPR) repeat protein
MDRGQEAVQLLDGAANQELEDRELIAAAAESLMLQGSRLEALDLLERAGARFPEEAAFLDARADLCRMLELPRKEAECHLRLFLLRDEGALHLRRAARAFARAGALDEGLGRISSMAKRSGSADQAAVSASLGYLYALKGDHARAAPLLEQAFAAPGFEPEKEEILALAETRMRGRDYQGAAGLLESRLNEDPGDVLIRAALAWAYHRAGASERSSKLIAESPGLMESGGILQALKARIERDR